MRTERPPGGPRRRIIAIVQARMGSTRLPGKVLLPLLGEPILSHIVQRLQRSAFLDAIVVATSRAPADEPIAALALDHGVPCVRGSEEDVLGRYVEAARWADAQHVVRITGDCPFVDPDVVDRLIEEHLRSLADYTSNTLSRSFPHGADVEVFTRQALETAAAEANQPWEREHVTPFLWTRPERFHLHNVVATPPLDHPEYRITVDTEEDYMLARAVYETLGSNRFSLVDVIMLFDRCPWLPYINRYVTQKVVITERDPDRALAQECLEAARWAERQDLHRVAALLRAEAERRMDKTR